MFHASQRISHSVHVLAQNVRLLGMVLYIFFRFVWLCIHSALYIADFIKLSVPRHALIVHQSGIVPFLKETAHGKNILTCIGLISTGPYKNTGVVFVPLQHISGSVYHTVLPLRKTARHIPGRFAGSHFLPGTMTFQIGLVNEINSIKITQLIPKSLIRIVTGTDCVNVVALHKQNVPHHVFSRDCPAFVHVKLMPVDSFKDQPFPIEAHDTVQQLEPSKANDLGNGLNHIPLRIFYKKIQGIAVRILSRPGLRQRNLPFHLQTRKSLFAFTNTYALLPDNLSICFF